MTKVAATEAAPSTQYGAAGARQPAAAPLEAAGSRADAPLEVDRFVHERIVERLGKAAADAPGVTPLPSRFSPFPVGTTLEFQGEDGWGNDGGRIAVEALQGGLCRLTVSTTGMLASPRVFEGRVEGDTILGSWSGAYGEQIDVRVLLGPAPVAALDIREIEDEPVYHFELAEKPAR